MACHFTSASSGNKKQACYKNEMLQNKNKITTHVILPHTK